MIKVGLTGNRYSGKDRTAKMFERISIPVFHADIVLKFLLNHNFEIQHNLKTNIGSGIFTNDGCIDTPIIRCMGGFDRLVNEAEFELLKAYEKFRLKHKQSIYCIFHSSILFERGWDKNMDYNISVFSPRNDRIERCAYITGDTIMDISKNIITEMDDIEKNSMSDYIIHNYVDDEQRIFGSLETQVNKIDQKIIDKYLQNEHKYQP